MRALVIAVVVLTALYSGYWVLGANRVESTAREVVAALPDQGVDLRVANIGTRGFPSRFDTTLTDLTYQSPDGLWRLALPFLQIFALSYRPNEVIVVPADTATLATGPLDWAIASAGLRASAKVSVAPQVPFEALTVESDGLTIKNETVGQGGLDRMLLAARAQPGTNSSYDVYADADALRFGDALTIDRLELRSVADLAAPLNRQSLAGAPAIEALDVVHLLVSVGQSRVTGSGTLTPDARGYAEGTVNLRITEWRDLIRILTSGAVLEAEIAQTYSAMAQALSSGADTVEVPLTFRDGLILTGFFPIGPAPRLR